MKQIRLAAVQTEPRFGEIQHNIETALAMIPEDCDLAVLPELCNTGYQFVDREEALAMAEPALDGFTANRVRRFAGDRNQHVVAGFAERDGDQVFNSALLARPDGSWELYRKVHLFWDEKDIFAPGDLGFPVFNACGTTIGIMICFDWIYPEAARTLTLKGATVICHPSNLVLPHCPDAMITRCLENRIFVATSNRVGTEHRCKDPLTFIGQSRVTSPLGEVLARCGGDQPQVAAAVADLTLARQAVTPRNDVLRDRRPETYEL